MSMVFYNHTLLDQMSRLEFKKKEEEETSALHIVSHSDAA